MNLETGFVLNNRYRIVKLLGQGGFGAVYRAWDISLNRPCAVKENLELADESQRQFSREASVLANLNHTNLPRVTDHFILPTGQYLVMDYIDGEDLGCMIQREGKLTWATAWPWIEQVTRAVIYLHAHKPNPIIHRDIKPANIRITPEGQAFLVDFGLVKVFDPNSRTTQGARAVTPGFSPPEQYGQGNTDVRTDLYALAATIYALLTGLEVPESVSRMIDDTIVPARQANPEVPYQVEIALRKAMQIRPADRYASVDQFYQAMRGQPQQVVPQQIPPERPAQRQAPPVVVGPPAGAGKPPAARPPVPQGSPAQQRVSPAQAAYPYAAQAPATPRVGAPGQAMPAAKKRSFPWVGCLIALLVIGGLGAAGFIGLYQIGAESLRKTEVANYWSQTQTASAQTAATEQARQQTAAAGTAVAQEAARQRTATVVTIMETAEAINAFTGEHLPTYGPVNGELEMIDDDNVAYKGSSLKLVNFIADVTFTNPYDSSATGWDYGFFFRDQGEQGEYRLIIRYDQTWTLISRPPQGEGTVVNSGTIPGLITDNGAENQLTLVCSGDRGWFYINGEYISPIDISERASAGDVAVASAIFTGDKIPGKVTRYTNLKVWSYP